MEIIRVEEIVEPHRRVSRWRWAWPVVIVAVAAMAALGWWEGRDDRHDDPAPPDPMRSAVTADQAVALTWSEWQGELQTRDCLAEHGLDYRPELPYTRRYALAAAQRLGREPAYVDIPLGGSYVLSYEDYSNDDLRWFAKVSEGGCVESLSPVNTSDRDAVASAVAAAAGDADFLDELGGAAWEVRNPEAWFARQIDAELASERTPLADAAEARSRLDEAVAIAQDSTDWMSLGVDEGHDALSAYGTGGGGAMVIFVEAAGTAHGRSDKDSHAALTCGDVQLSIATPDWLVGANNLLTQLWTALEGQWCSGS